MINLSTKVSSKPGPADATQARLGTPKAEVIRDVLAPKIDVIPRNERFRFFLARIGYGQTSVSPVVSAGLDDERVRHDVQRLWAL